MKKILLTTTESLHGWEIETYLKPVFSNVVVGAGFMSDFSASFTDLFGGRSNSYEKKLQAVNDSALQILQSKASEIGANCIIGLKVNVHQISGKNVQMFMVSAYGTAIVAKSLLTAKTTNSLKEADKSTVVDKANLRGLLNDLESGNLKLTMTDLQLIVDSKASDFKDYIYKKLKKRTLEATELEQQSQKDVERLYFEYFSLIEPLQSISVLYDALLNETDRSLINKILEIIKAFDLLDYEHCIKLLTSESLKIKKLALEILTYNKPVYIYEYITEIQKVTDIIRGSFPTLANLSTKKGFLSSNEKEVWICKCSKSNPVNERYCNSCANDQYGFIFEELQPNAVINDLNNKALALKELFESVN